MKAKPLVEQEVEPLSLDHLEFFEEPEFEQVSAHYSSNGDSDEEQIDDSQNISGIENPNRQEPTPIHMDISNELANVVHGDSTIQDIQLIQNPCFSDLDPLGNRNTHSYTY